MKRDFAALSGRHFDLLVCGGGIYGAWTAYDAALRGLRVAIVEQGDWGSATSSASSKLIHGGLRYLETYDFKLVKKALRERQMLLKAAPHRVWPLRFGVPVYQDSRVGMLRLKAGLTLYDMLASGSDKRMSHRRFNIKGFAEHFPALDVERLKGGYTYGDAQTDDARLVLELIAGAMDAGAVCVNYCKLTGYIESNGHATGARVTDQISRASAEIYATCSVNTTGQWISATPQGSDWCRLAKGIHLVLPAMPGDEALLLTAKSDGRVFFLIPWYGQTLLGTTDTDYRGDLDHVRVEPAEIEYLLDAANHYLNTAWTEQDVVGSFAGVRVLQRSSAIHPSSASRDWTLQTAGNGVHYAVGGKITSAREDASSIVDSICAQQGMTMKCRTHNRPFPWKPEREYGAWSQAASDEARRLGIDSESAKWLLRRHGKHVDEIFAIIEHEPRFAQRILPALPFVYADLLYCTYSEMAVHLDDLLRRRMPMLILARLSADELRNLAEFVAAAMGWDAGTTEREIALCQRQ